MERVIEETLSAYADMGGWRGDHGGIGSFDLLERKTEEMKNKEHLPMYGVEPIYAWVIIAVTIAAIVFRHTAPLKIGIFRELKIPSIIVGILLIVFGISLWTGAVFRAKVDVGITNNRLVTTGVYALCRNPIYSAIMFCCTGALLISGNVFFYPLFFFYWGFMTLLMKCTEEKWLKNLYGKEYEEYCKCVNRCIPWKMKKQK